ncbi:MAG: TetR/AcrR family transcriptional regulator [Saccharospirillaceae bacterium]|nr:TetR/AcrR family transcriptional regulator [Pseudomonadales bacterium]NRB77805.1 TetR/AcrR family transcriptional regulator [Saccharospirillaceae bacterium]
MLYQKSLENIVNRQDKKQQTRETILNSASRLFQEQGFTNVSTRQIAKDSGVGVGTVFAHFKDKQALTTALFHNKIDGLLLLHLQRCGQEKTGLSYFLRFAQFFYDFYEEDRAFSIALLQNALFDVTFFQQQMDLFITQVANKLQNELPKHSEQQRFNIAKAWFGFYMFHLLSGLKQNELSAKQWLATLKVDCAVLLTSTVAAQHNLLK